MSLRGLSTATAAIRPAVRPAVRPTICARAFSQSTRLDALPRSAIPTGKSGASGASGSSGPKGSGESDSRRRATRIQKTIMWASLLPIIGYWFFPQRRVLNPAQYSEHTIDSVQLLSPRHAELSVRLLPQETRQFGKGAFPFPYVGYTGSIYSVSPQMYEALVAQTQDETPDDGSVVVQHVMLRNPDIQIERHYTPVNDVARDGRMNLVVKKVRNGELGRMVFGLKKGDQAGFRGPITTFSIKPDEYDTVVMVSTGTAVAPFLQLLDKAKVGNTKYKLLQAQAPERDDWSAKLIKKHQQKYGDKLDVNRIPQGEVQKEDIADALADAGRVCVLVCLPPKLMGPFCGPLTPTLEQGPLTGTLKELGLNSKQVWKLE
ncbi:hypothetical protein A1Q2_02715 [Trichosporon asahii var. asahii CBS 8904]|uniref:Flavoprotein pyridine nucleotide cytochrome reductase-like FAD-binding domain-containing protein n=2 Tax=Trichosporon asahii var. asahii TaxID=189963 RepID=K1W239_TRIAC|nr:hypothetical protein A1Q1_07242 [Trichosporon asahii var. asahii CBS 2479]EJT51480.1 hypothetical protein A1Q1_07242 [Trichosporon asahii var. asahii CBS 2479]EKD02998.1 hypothetical protein A1Q2_02715 [Trichosporon asahii var. asahii CBS 8904]